MKKNAVVFLADGFEEIETLAVVDLLRRADINVILAGVTGDKCTGAHNIIVSADDVAENVKVEEFDAFICPGGGLGAQNLKNSKLVTSLIKDAFDKGKLVAAICAAPIALEEAGIMNGKKATIYPAMKDCLEKAAFIDSQVVADNNIITAQGPAASFAFGFALIEYLVGKAASDKVASDTLFSKFY